MFLRAAVTKYSKGSGFKQQKLTLSVAQVKDLNQGVSGTMPSILALGAYPFLCLRKYTRSYQQSEHALSCPHHSTHMASTLCVIASSSLWGVSVPISVFLQGHQSQGLSPPNPV